MCDHRVPNLSCLAQMHSLGDALDGSLARCTEMIAIELDRVDTAGARRKVRRAALAGRGISQRHDASCVEESVWCHKLLPNCKLRPHFCFVHCCDYDAEVARQVAKTQGIEVVRRVHRWPRGMPIS